MKAWLKMHGRALLLLPWIGLILGLLTTGGYRDYVADWHASLQIIALVILLFAFFGDLVRTSLIRLEQAGHLPDSEHGPAHHPHQTQAPLSITLILAHLIPMILFMAVGPATLTVQPNTQEQLNRLYEGLLQVRTKSFKEKYTQDGYLITDLAGLHGQFRYTGSVAPKVVLVGQVFTLPQDQLAKAPPELRQLGVRSYLFRFIMSCCAADARPVSVALSGADLGTVDHQAWFEIKGEPLITQGKVKFIVLKVAEIKQIPKPADPYLFLLF